MGICVIHNCNFNKIEWNSGHMLKWLCMNDGRCYMTKCTTSDHITFGLEGCGNDEDGQIINLIHNIVFILLPYLG